MSKPLFFFFFINHEKNLKVDRISAIINKVRNEQD